MAAPGGIQGQLQEQIMATLWRIEAGTVEQVRAALPARYQGAYTTVQTVLNRLADRALLVRERQGHAFVYRPRVSEPEYLSQSIESTLSGASAAARQAVLARLVGGLDSSELQELQELSKQAEARRHQRKR